LEKDPKEADEVLVAFEVYLEEDDESFELDKLTLDQLRMLCKNVGIRYVNNYSKFQCRKLLWVLAHDKEGMEKENGTKTLPLLDRRTSNIIRITNIIFSHGFLDSFLLTLKDISNHVDQDISQLPRNFWGDVAEVLNRSGDDDDIARQVVIAEEDEHYEEIISIDVQQQIVVMSSTVIRKKVFQLLKVRKEIQKITTQHGEYASDPYHFIDIAMKVVGGVNGLTKLGCYYFFKRCDDNPEVDASFATNEMNGNLMGQTDQMLTSATDTNSKKRKRTYETMVDIYKTTKNIAEEVKETNRLVGGIANEMKEMNRLTRQSQLISLAQHLGKHDILERMLASVTSSFND
jgi:hypothetical protein